MIHCQRTWSLAFFQKTKKHNPDGTCILHTKVFFKPTDTHQLLHRSSFHPAHTFKSIVRSQFIRFKRISTSFYDYQQASSTLIRFLSSRGYTLPSLLKIKRHIWNNYTPSTQSTNPPLELIPIITFFDTHHACINQAWKTIIESNYILQSARTLSTFCKHRTLRNHLVKGKYTAQDPEVLLDALITVLQR